MVDVTRLLSDDEKRAVLLCSRFPQLLGKLIEQCADHSAQKEMQSIAGPLCILMSTLRVELYNGRKQEILDAQAVHVRPN